MNRHQLFTITILGLASNIPNHAFAGSSFGVTLMETDNSNCMLITDSDSQKRYGAYKQMKSKFDSRGFCKISAPYIEPVSFCALTGIDYSAQLTMRPYCLTTISKTDENFKSTADKSKWSIEFVSQKGVTCQFVCVEN
jgi:hypothetical protein